MKGIVLEHKGGMTYVLSENGEFRKVKSMIGVEVGDEVEIKKRPSANIYSLIAIVNAFTAAL